MKLFYLQGNDENEIKKKKNSTIHTNKIYKIYKLVVKWILGNMILS